MADPLSIAGSVVGITAAGVQASVKLYALAEKVTTASQRVVSIADDISSTCAILNQVRELIIPQPDAQGVLKSVFNAVALKDISDALQRCRSVFTEIGILLRRAFEQVGKRPALHSNIELSVLEKAKWPFLQPQFDDLRSDLRDAKGNLILMIAVATLALAQRDGRQRPIHETERLELGSTIVQLKQARTIRAYRPPVKKVPNQPLNRTTSFGEGALGSTDTNSTDASLPSSQQNADPVLRSSFRERGLASGSKGVSLTRLPLAPPGNTRLQEKEILHKSSSTTEVEANILARSPPDARSIASAGSGLLHEPHPFKQPFLQKYMASMSVSRSAITTRPAKNRPQMRTTSRNVTPTSSTSNTSDETSYYQGWYTDYLQGLTTGYGDSITLSKMELPDQSLQKLVKTYFDEGHDPYIRMLELTKEQQDIIKENCSMHSQAELVYVNLQRNVTISSVFGTLNIETLKWIVNIKGPAQPTSPIVQNSMVCAPPPSTSIRRTSAMKTLFMRLIGAKGRSSTLDLPLSGNECIREFPEVPGESLRNPDLSGLSATGRFLSSSVEIVPEVVDTNNSESSQNNLGRRDTLEVPKIVHSRRESALIPPLFENDGEDIVKELLAQWTIS